MYINSNKTKFVFTKGNFYYKISAILSLVSITIGGQAGTRSFGFELSWSIHCLRVLGEEDSRDIFIYSSRVNLFSIIDKLFSVYLSVCLTFRYLSLAIYLFIYQSIYLSIHLFTYLSIYLSIYPSIYLSIHPFINLSAFI